MLALGIWLAARPRLREPGPAKPSGTPSEVVRAYYTALRESRFRDAMMMSVLRPAVEAISAAEFAEYRPDFERLVPLVPPDFQITGEQISGDEATVFVKTGEDKEVKVEPVFVLEKLKLALADIVWTNIRGRKRTTRRLRINGRFFTL